MLDNEQSLNAMQLARIDSEIKKKAPIGQLITTREIAYEYSGNKFEAALKDLSKSTSNGGRGYIRARKMRRDGNCFYRGYLF